MHDDELEHSHVSDNEREEMARFIWGQESLELTTVGIDIGSSTSHLFFAKILMQRQSQSLSSRFMVTKRDVIWRSPIMLTPFLSDGAIDAASLGGFIQNAYREAGLARGYVDSGAVILTGEAIKRKNAKAIDELFAEEAGKFVCATAGHRLECTLAAHGSGAVNIPKSRKQCLLHVDIGGGTTKLALIDSGKIVSVSAFAVGGRLIAADADGAWTRVDDSALAAAEDLGVATDPETLAHAEVRRAVAQRLAGVAVDFIIGQAPDALGRKLMLTEALASLRRPKCVTFSGGVSEYLFGREQRAFGDIAMDLAEALRAEFSRRLQIPILDPGQGIRATVIGASQFTVQVSGKTIYLPNPNVLPVHNVPVVRIDMESEPNRTTLAHSISAAIARADLDPASRLALAFTWPHAPEYAKLAAAAGAIADTVSPKRRDALLILVIDGDFGKTFGHLLRDEFGLTSPLVSIDGVQLQDLDFVDVGELVNLPGVVPVVIKSLLFS